MEPVDARIETDLVEHETGRIGVRLINRGSRTARLLSVRSSCNCLEIRGANGQPLSPELILPAGEQLPVEVLINTSGRGGATRNSVVFRFEGEGLVQEVECHVSAAVRPGWRLVPRELSLRDDSGAADATGLIDVFDGYPGDGLELSTIDCSMPGLVETTVQRVSDSQVAPHGPVDLRWRYRITVRAARREALQEAARCFLLLRPKREGIPSVAVPVTLPATASSLRARPSAIIWDLASASAGARQIIRCESAALTPLDELEVCDAPDWLEARVFRQGKDAGRWRLDARLLAVPAGDERQGLAHVALCSRSDPRVAIRIPVAFLEAP
jgi:hypothetical protein